MNLGYLKKEKTLSDWRAGNFTPLSGRITNPEFWTKYLPVVEVQIVNGVETRSCTTFSALNCLEVLHYRQTGKRLNFNDQFTAILSGTTQAGNYFSNVWASIRNDGLIPQHALEFTGTTFKDWINPDQITDALKEDGKEFLGEWNIYREWVNKNNPFDIYTELGSAPLHVSVAFANGKGILNPTGKINHAVMLYDAKIGEYFEIFDHYTQTTKKYDWHYKFGAVLKPSLISKNNDMPKFKENTLLQLVEGSGGFGLYANDKLYVDSLDKILASFMVRNKGDIKSMALPITLEDWNKLEKYDLSNNRIN